MKIPAGWMGNGGPATEALLSNPFSVSTDRSGLIYIADSSHNIVRVIDGSGIIRTIAGTGKFGFSGDGVLAVNAQLATPLGVFAAATGDIYIADMFNNRIRMIDDNGLISTVGGTGIRGFSGDGGPANIAALASPAGIFVTREGSIFIADQGNHRIRMIDTQWYNRNRGGHRVQGIHMEMAGKRRKLSWPTPPVCGLGSQETCSWPIGATIESEELMFRE